MGRIFLIVGPRGVGKTTLFNYAIEKGEFIVFHGNNIPSQGYDLNDASDFIKYQDLYIKRINKQNSFIQGASLDGLVARSIEESGYYFLRHNFSNILMNYYDDIRVNPQNIMVDKIFYLDAEMDVLKYRCEHDTKRNKEHSRKFYEEEYYKHKSYFLHLPNTVYVDTTKLLPNEVYAYLCKKIE